MIAIYIARHSRRRVIKALIMKSCAETTSTLRENVVAERMNDPWLMLSKRLPTKGQLNVLTLSLSIPSLDGEPLRSGDYRADNLNGLTKRKKIAR